MTRILLADDHPIVREGLKKILARGDDLDVVAEAETSAETIRRALGEEVDVVILDLHMPGRGGLGVLEKLQEQAPGIHVMIVSMYPPELYGPRALEAGALAYLDKTSVPDHLLAAVTKVARGERYTTPEMTEILAESADDPG